MMNTYRNWFFAAAAYNLVWGLAAILFPLWFFRIAGMAEPSQPWLFQCIGMMVMVYAPAYYLIGRDPERYAVFAWIGLLGKAFGPIGMAIGLSRGEITPLFCLNTVFNDVIWLPMLVLFVIRYSPRPWRTG